MAKAAVPANVQIDVATARWLHALLQRGVGSACGFAAREDAEERYRAGG
jgi:hypothetical protein